MPRSSLTAWLCLFVRERRCRGEFTVLMTGPDGHSSGTGAAIHHRRPFVTGWAVFFCGMAAQPRASVTLPATPHSARALRHQPDQHHQQTDDRCQPDKGAQNWYAGGVKDDIDDPSNQPDYRAGRCDAAYLVCHRQRQRQRDEGRIGFERLCRARSGARPRRFLRQGPRRGVKTDTSGRDHRSRSLVRSLARGGDNAPAQNQISVEFAAISIFRLLFRRTADAVITVAWNVAPQVPISTRFEVAGRRPATQRCTAHAGTQNKKPPLIERRLSMIDLAWATNPAPAVPDPPGFP